LAVTRGGLLTAGKISRTLDCDLYTLEKFAGEPGLLAIQGSLPDFMAGIFSRYREIIMVMSCGIAVRSIAPHLKSKVSDPAVVVLDEKGQHVISLLSGHLGGANRLAKEVASVTGGQAVITTASDTLGVPSVDLFAQAHGLAMLDMAQVKRVTAALVNGERVALVSDGWQGETPPELQPMTWEQVKAEQPAALIYVGRDPAPEQPELTLPVAWLVPRDLVLGVGCRRDTDPERMQAAVAAFFAEHHLPLPAVALVATVDVKEDEAAVIQLAEKLGVPLQIISRTEIAQVEQLFSCSDFVRATIGVGCVAEPAAYLASGGGTCLVARTAAGGITLAVFEKTAHQPPAPQPEKG